MMVVPRECVKALIDQLTDEQVQALYEVVALSIKPDQVLQEMQELTLEKLKMAVPLRDPCEFYDDWDDAEVDAAYVDVLREGYLALAESHRADAELFLPAQVEVLQND